MSGLVCPHCSERFDPEDRCPSERGLGRCMDKAGHLGWHWSDVGFGNGILIWTGRYSRRSCPERLGINSRWCEKPCGHEGAHRCEGVTFWEEGDDASPTVKAVER